MFRLVAYLMFGVAVLSLVLLYMTASTSVMLADGGLVKPTAKLEMLVLFFCGTVIPVGLGALLLKHK